MARDTGLDTLLDLDGSIFDQEHGYWIKIDARKIKTTQSRPHGIKYCLTLHNPSGKRILGFDNAHSIQASSKGKYQGEKFAYDHKHGTIKDSGKAYKFSDPYQLMNDFFNEADEALKKHREEKGG